MQNSTNVITLNDRRRRCEGCRFSAECLFDSADEKRTGKDASSTGIVVRRGAHLFRAGDPFETLYLVRSGAVKTYQVSADGEQRVTGFYLPGDIVGLESIGSDTCASSAIALDTSGLCGFPYQRLREPCQGSDGVSEKLLRSMSAKIREKEQALVALGNKSADERMAWFLAGLSARQASRGFSPTEFNLPMSRSDMGSFLTLAVETVSRVLTRLQANGIIEVRRSQVKVKSPEKLRRLGESCGNTEALAMRPNRTVPAYRGNLRGQASILQPVAH